MGKRDILEFENVHFGSIRPVWVGQGVVGVWIDGHVITGRIPTQKRPTTLLLLRHPPPFGKRYNLNALPWALRGGPGWVLREAIRQEKCSFLNIVQKAFDPPPLYLNICPILQVVFFKTRFWALKMVVIMYLFHPQISPSMPQKSLFMQISCC